MQRSIGLVMLLQAMFSERRSKIMIKCNEGVQNNDAAPCRFMRRRHMIVFAQIALR